MAALLIKGVATKLIKTDIAIICLSQIRYTHTGTDFESFEMSLVRWENIELEKRFILFKIDLIVTVVRLYTVKSLLVAAATINFRGFLLRPQIKGGHYLRAATNTKFPKNYVKMH